MSVTKAQLIDGKVATVEFSGGLVSELTPIEKLANVGLTVEELKKLFSLE